MEKFYKLLLLVSLILTIENCFSYSPGVFPGSKRNGGYNPSKNNNRVTSFYRMHSHKKQRGNIIMAGIALNAGIRKLALQKYPHPDVKYIESVAGLTFLLGNEKLRVPVSFSTNSVDRRSSAIHFQELTIDLNYTLGEIAFSKGKYVRSYLISGLSSRSMSLYGKKTDDNNFFTPLNGNYFGDLKQKAVQAGVGLEYHLINSTNFFQIFLEGKNAFTIQSTSSQKELQRLKSTHNLGLNFGVRFGIVN